MMMYQTGIKVRVSALRNEYRVATERADKLEALLAQAQTDGRKQIEDAQREEEILTDQNIVPLQKHIAELEVENNRISTHISRLEKELHQQQQKDLEQALQSSKAISSAVNGLVNGTGSISFPTSLPISSQQHIHSHALASDSTLLQSMVEQITLSRNERDRLRQQQINQQVILKELQDQLEKVTERSQSRIDQIKESEIKEFNNEKTKFDQLYEKNHERLRLIQKKSEDEYEKKLKEERRAHKRELDRLLLELKLAEERSNLNNQDSFADKTHRSIYTKQIGITVKKERAQLIDKLDRCTNDNIKLKSQISELQQWISTANSSILAFTRRATVLQKDKDSFSFEIAQLKAHILFNEEENASLRKQIPT
ncbi:MAG: hypothetical protein EZS28_013911 [Streblomastix strix]|uniref:Uncharacterized protein n=1 Tax=Streblomastix strix TaxID=222440 RepID=A0A5J4W6I6_9EUKA|nr:MAG: hypothetical protein EZS28_013911 [Streblomastix strix]